MTHSKRNLLPRIPEPPRSRQTRQLFIIHHSLLIILLACVPSRAQDANRFLDWSHQDAGHLLEHHFPTMLLIGAGGATFVAAGSYVDEPILNGVQSVLDRDDLAVKITNQLGNKRILTIPIAIFGIATLAGDSKLQDAAFTSIQAFAYAGIITTLLKETAGRHRPEEGAGPRRFEPFSGHHSSPSGHATIVFSVVTPWVYYYDHPATYALYALGAGTAISRVVRDRHWPTDVIAGGTIGFLTARYLSKRHLDERERGYEPVVAMPLLAFRSGGLNVSVAALASAR